MQGLHLDIAALIDVNDSSTKITNQYSMIKGAERVNQILLKTMPRKTYY